MVMDVLFGSLLALLDVIFFVFAFSLLAVALIFGAFGVYVIRAFCRSERR